MKLPDSPDPCDIRDAELSALRLRLALGLDISDAPLEERVLARVLNRIEQLEEAEEEQDSGRVVGRARWRDRAPGVLIAACLVLLLIVGVITWPSMPAMAVPPGLVYDIEPENVRVAPSAEEFLQDLANTAEGAPASGSGTTQYLVTSGWSTATVGDENATAIRPFKREFWIAEDGSALAIESQGDALLPDGTLDPSPAVPSIDGASDVFPPGALDEILYGFSREPDLLREQLLEGREPECRQEEGMAWCLMEAIANHAVTYVVPADLNGTFWRMLAETPHVYLLGETSDRMGRPAVAIASLPVETSFETTVLVLLADPSTGRILGRERISLESELIDIDRPSVTSFTTITESRWVDESDDM